ncbi:MAG TPA: discoidin domain-containing protein [Polyangia bacterium]
MTSARLAEWFVRRKTLAEARARVPRPDEPAGRAFEQVRLLREVARQVAEPVELPTAGRPAAVLLSLHRDLVYWTLVARERSDGGALPDFAALWQRTPPERLQRAAGSAANLEAVERLLVGMSQPAPLETKDEDAALVRAFADALYEDLAAPRRRVVRLGAERVLRIAGAAALVAAAVLGVRALVRGPSLHATIRASSWLASCAPDPSCAALMFHTDMQNDPWVEFDLGAPKPIHKVEISNRGDCCQDRNVPTIVEISADAAHWRQIARNDQEFSSWTAKLPPNTTARFVRLRVPRHTFFGFKDVQIR